MRDADLFLELAAIAGVFVGFGALIAVRSGGASGRFEVAYMRGVVSWGLLTIVAALAPVTLSRYDLSDHSVWALSSVVVIAGWVAISVADARTPEYREAWATVRAADRAGARPRWVVAAEWVALVLLMALLTVTPIMIIVGVVPELEAALYYAMVVLLLLAAGWTLLSLVFAQRRPAAV